MNRLLKNLEAASKSTHLPASPAGSYSKLSVHSLNFVLRIDIRPHAGHPHISITILGDVHHLCFMLKHWVVRHERPGGEEAVLHVA